MRTQRIAAVMALGVSCLAVPVVAHHFCVENNQFGAAGGHPNPYVGK